MASSHRRQDSFNCLISTQFRWVRVGGVNTTADKTRQFCLVRAGGVNKLSYYEKQDYRTQVIMKQTDYKCHRTT